MKRRKKKEFKVESKKEGRKEALRTNRVLRVELRELGRDVLVDELLDLIRYENESRYSQLIEVEIVRRERGEKGRTKHIGNQSNRELSWKTRRAVKRIKG